MLPEFYGKPKNIIETMSHKKILNFIESNFDFVLIKEAGQSQKKFSDALANNCYATVSCMKEREIPFETFIPLELIEDSEELFWYCELFIRTANCKNCTAFQCNYCPAYSFLEFSQDTYYEYDNFIEENNVCESERCSKCEHRKIESSNRFEWSICSKGIKGKEIQDECSERDFLNPNQITLEEYLKKELQNGKNKKKVQQWNGTRSNRI